MNWLPVLASDRPTYLALADAIEQGVATGELVPGQRLPTHRDLADALGVTVGTVSRGYAKARSRELIRGEVGRGTFVCAGRSPSPRRVAGRIDLSLNLPLCGPPPSYRAAMLDLAEQPELLEYGDPVGSKEARMAGTRWLALHGVEADPSEVVVTCGAQHATLVSLAACCRPGDTVLSAALTYPGFTALARTLNLQVVPVAHDEDGLRPDDLERVLDRHEVRALHVVPSLHNPVPSVLSDERRTRVCELIRDRDIWVIEDDLHRLMLDRGPPPLAARLPDQVLYLTSLSKVLYGGLRIGYLKPPASLSDQVEEEVWGSCWSASPLSAALATRWILDGTAERLVTQRREEARIRARIAREMLPTEVVVHPLGYHVWWPLPHPWTAGALMAAAATQGVAVASAAAFAVFGTVPPEAIRLSLSGPRTHDELRRGLSIVVDLVTTGPPRTRL